MPSSASVFVRRPVRWLQRALLLERPAELTDLGMSSAGRLGHEARAARSLERVYHTGQDRVWDGRAVLAELVERHGGVDVPEPARGALHQLLSAMLWGELAAWKVSAALAAELDNHEARLAATAQAHDEARHFYVIYDYLRLLGRDPGRAPTSAHRVLERVLDADTLAKRLVGMQLLVEPVALTLFTVMRRSQVCPVLAELLPYLERDEARHIQVGTNLLPELVGRMGWAEALDYWAYQARLFHLEVRGLAQLEPALRALGCEPRDVFHLGMSKQLGAARLVTGQLGPGSERAIDVLRTGMAFQWAYQCPDSEGEGTDRWSRVRAGWAGARSEWQALSGKSRQRSRSVV